MRLTNFFVVAVLGYCSANAIADISQNDVNVDAVRAPRPQVPGPRGPGPVPHGAPKPPHKAGAPGSPHPARPHRRVGLHDESEVVEILNRRQFPKGKGKGKGKFGKGKRGKRLDAENSEVDEGDVVEILELEKRKGGLSELEARQFPKGKGKGKGKFGKGKRGKRLDAQGEETEDIEDEVAVLAGIEARDVADDTAYERASQLAPKKGKKKGKGKKGRGKRAKRLGADTEDE